MPKDRVDSQAVSQVLIRAVGGQNRDPNLWRETLFCCFWLIGLLLSVDILFSGSEGKFMSVLNRDKARLTLMKRDCGSD